MSKYIFLYRGPATPMEDFTPEQGQEQMAAWNAWMENAGSAVVDFGNPFAARTAIADDGSRREAADLNGYTIVEAADLSAATALTEKHPVPHRGQGALRDRGLRARPDVSAQAPAGETSAGSRGSPAARLSRRTERPWRSPSTDSTTRAAHTSAKPATRDGGIGSS